jgi:cell division protein FtsB
MLRLARRLGVLGGTAGFAALLAVGVFPTRTWLDQRAATSEAESRLEILREQNASLEERIWRLEDDAEIERLAREQYNLVMPGEEAYIVLPPPLPPLDLPPIWPFGRLTDDPPENPVPLDP